MLLPIRVAQLVRANTKKYGPNKRHMVLGSDFATNDILNLSGAGCCWAVNTPMFGSSIESPKGLAMEGSLIIKKNKIIIYMLFLPCAFRIKLSA